MQRVSAGKAKKVVEETTIKTVKATSHFIRWIFILLAGYVGIVTFLGYISTGQEFLATVATASVGGFWAFFFGYFGWRLGQSIEDYFNRQIIKK